MISDLQHERQLTLSALSGDAQARLELREARVRLDVQLTFMVEMGDLLAELAPTAFTDAMHTSTELLARVPEFRQRADLGQLTTREAYDFYNTAVDIVTAGSYLTARVAPDAATSVALMNAASLFQSVEAVSRSTALATTALNSHPWHASDLIEFGNQVGIYRGGFRTLPSQLDATVGARLSAMAESDPWRQVNAVADLIIQYGSPDPASTSLTLQISPATWQAAVADVGSGLLELWHDQSLVAQEAAKNAGKRTTDMSILGGGITLLVTGSAFAAALVLANRLIARLIRLRRDTLELADEQLPDIMRRLRAGEQVDPTSEISRHDHGSDEIGHVAAAFDRAYHAAVGAAIAESKTRAGVSAVFLKIAYRSQVIAHRQLEVLDRAERELDDPAQLETLFELDHLATRARRQAENLTILGGEQPGRRWRNSVLLLDLIRSAVAETLEYTKIDVQRVPEVYVIGDAVADIVHLLAELMDNATTFAPPQARTEVAVAVIGRGIAVEIIDQGIGMTPAELTERNAMLAEPPDFSVATLAGDPRLGFFVVAKLAARRDISVRLAESNYGGTRAIVLVPAILLADQTRQSLATSTQQPVGES
ncbi:nitrate- and nitrite sensing domain-containing protein [Nocardia salmonicida]|uniref:sensor histidine kinase n=1 Tax=Nocardia salmonicida TaxID=53431 RepID=UPI0037A31706